jgi:thiol-disulfide isomerase/thioredoxin
MATTAILLASCSNKALIDAKINNPSEEYVTITALADPLATPDTVFLGDDGEFKYAPDKLEEGFYAIRNGRNRSIFYLSPSYALTFETDAAQFSGQYEITGKGAEVNQYLMKEKQFLNELKPTNPMLFGLDEESFIDRSQGILNSWKGFIDEQENLPENFVEMAHQTALYDWALTRAYYQDAHRYFSQNDSFSVSDNYYDFIKELDLDNPELIKIEKFRMFVQYYPSVAAQENYLSDSEYQESEIGLLRANYESASNTFSNPDIKTYSLFTVLKEQVDYYGIKNIESIYNDFLEKCTNESYKEYVQEAYGKWEAIKPGKKSINFSYPDLNGDYHSLEDFKGKYVYIDVWATWCNPCLAEVPYLDSLAHEMKNNNIEIISISVDEDKESWGNMIMRDNPSWLQLYAGGFESSVAEFFLIKAIPRFILLDREGNILDAHAQRPSKNIREFLLTLEGI